MCVGGKIDALKLMSERLCCLQSHDAITLLHHSPAIPRLPHADFTEFLSSRLQDYDHLLQSLLSQITNIQLESKERFM